MCNKMVVVNHRKYLEAIVPISMRKLGQVKKLAGTTWGADTNILRRV